MYIVKNYHTEDSKIWNNFVHESRNGTFLFDRAYMDYHSDRFEDYSLMVYDSKENLVALLPGNIKEKTYFTHQGLTYGGILTLVQTGVVEFLAIADAIHEYLKSKEISSLVYKKTPYIYGTQPTDEDAYMLFRKQAKQIACNISSCIEMTSAFKLHRSRKSAISKANKQGLKVHKNQFWPEFWNILSKNLQQKYDAQPVHSLSEILKLHNDFPNNIHLYTASNEQECLGGIVIYESKNVAHAQYISLNEKGKELCALDFILDHLLQHEFKHKKYFDLGASTEQNGLVLNEGLVFQKEGYGARGVCYQIYEYDL